MKQLLFLLSFIMASTFLKADPPAAPATSKLKFATTEHDFGTQAQGKPVTYEFEFANTSSEPIVLENVKASCGCTTPTWTKEPVMPGKKGSVKAQYSMARE
ncbi:MAG: hypothetical protein JWM28_142, partial [Chitinophagaceae bacterium]|nr:hypothetical protein [Chitinophagaceae bacterium]